MDKRRISQLDNIVISALKNNVFPGAAVGFSQWTGESYECTMKHYGYSQLTPQKKILTKETFYDLASLTKPFVTVPVFLAFFQKKILQLEDRIGDIFSDCPIDKRNITLRNLLSHRSGLPDHREYFHEIINLPFIQKKEEILQKILHEKLQAEPGDKVCYSDLGFILLGLIVEQISGNGLDEEVENKIFTPLGLQNTLFFKDNKKNKGTSYACTEKCMWKHKMLCGEVHDDNCRAMGGVAGHAGLFGTLQGVIKLCENMLDQYKERRQHPAYANTLLRQAWKREQGVPWTLGFDTPAKQGSSSGRYFSPASVGHLGFTGTSFWIDPEKECIVVLLTNRVHPSRKNEKIRKFRPILHDTLMKGIGWRG